MTIAAIKDEYKCLMKNNTLMLVDRLKDSKILSNRWIFKIKRKQNGDIKRYKARLVVRENEQRESINFDVLFAPVARFETIRTFIAACVQKECMTMDVIAAYVQGDLSATIYMNQPKAFSIKGHEDKYVY
ncbi:reverse [Lasius niger]|uniref:Reverse n=1 Tax=Lasius niger TaxID=67767 RepID=A0A0J7KA32_LASNI|nr:reverse [Lasius niger]